jgi:hypothetical protein
MLKDDNSIRDQFWIIQIDHFELNCTSCTMKQACKRHRSKARRYKMSTNKLISSKNKQLRKEYVLRHQNDTIESFWQYIRFINETHFDLDESYSKKVLREEETRYKVSNMQIMFDLWNVKLHFVVSIFWNLKSSLQFYNDKHDSLTVIIKKSLKLNRSWY